MYSCEIGVSFVVDAVYIVCFWVFLKNKISAVYLFTFLLSILYVAKLTNDNSFLFTNGFHTIGETIQSHQGRSQVWGRGRGRGRGVEGRGPGVVFQKAWLSVLIVPPKQNTETSKQECALK